MMNKSEFSRCLFLALVITSFFCARAQAEEYTLTKLDQEYLAQAEQIEQDFNERGLVLAAPEITGYLERIADRLADPSDFGPHVKLRVKLFRHPYENAFAFGDGSLYVSLGLVSVVENENQLAAVLAHEISHLELNHPFQGYKDYVTSSTISNLAVVITGVPPENSVLFYMAINGYSRKLEKEADLKALELLDKAGYDPHAMIEVLDVLDRNLNGEPEDETPIFWSDHPTTEKRKQYLKEYLDEGSFASNFSPDFGRHDYYLGKTASILRRTCALNIDYHRFGTASAIAESALKSLPDDPEVLVDLGMTRRAWAEWAAEKKARLAEIAASPECKKTNCSKNWKELPMLIKDAPELEDAEGYLLKALEISPSLARAYFELGELYAAMGKKEQAIDNFKKFLSLKPKGMDKIKAMRRIEELEAGPEAADKAPDGEEDQPEQQGE